jgi:hypothetical protein
MRSRGDHDSNCMMGDNDCSVVVLLIVAHSDGVSDGLDRH